MYYIKDTEFNSGIEIEYQSISIFKVSQDSLVAIYDSDLKRLVKGEVRKNSDLAIIDYLIKKLSKSLN